MWERLARRTRSRSGRSLGEGLPRRRSAGQHVRAEAVEDSVLVALVAGEGASWGSTGQAPDLIARERDRGEGPACGLASVR